MNVNFFNEENNKMEHTGFFSQPPQKKRKRYGFMRFLWDCFMTVITGGLWLIWIFVREMRKR